jgi:hypothetical protein
MTRNPAPASICAQCDFPAPDIPIRDNLITYPRRFFSMASGSVRLRLDAGCRSLTPHRGIEEDSLIFILETAQKE